MENETNVAPAGDNAITPAPVEAPQAPKSLTADEAGGLLAQWEEKRNPSPETPEPAAAEPEAIEESAEKAEPAPEAEPESESEPEQFVNGNAKTRMRDGTAVAVGDLKKDREALQEYRAKMPQLTAYEQQLQQRAAQIAQQQQLFRMFSLSPCKRRRRTFRLPLTQTS
jgi:hypothetical protein